MGSLIISEARTSEHDLSVPYYMEVLGEPLEHSFCFPKALIDAVVQKPSCRKDPNKVKLSKFKSDSCRG